MKSSVIEIDAGKPLPIYPGKACGGCTACCDSVPVKEINLGAYVRCPHLRAPPDLGHGCGIYADRPWSCRAWSCIWMISDLPEEYRPDRLGVVLDPIPDLVRVEGEEMVASQFWVLPGHEDDWRNPDAPIMELVEQCFERGMAVLWRTKDPAGGQRARVFLRRDGRNLFSEDDKAKEELPGYADDGERLRAAQKRMSRR